MSPVQGLLSGRRAAWAVLLVPAWLMLWTARDMWLSYSPTPFNDQWVNIHWWRDAPAYGWLKYLVSQHNEHRIVFPRLIFLADWKWFQGRNGLNIAAIGLIQLAGAAFFAAAAQVRRITALGLLGLAAATSLIFSLMQWENLFWGFQAQFVGVYAAAAWAIYVFCLASADPDRVRWPAMAGAVALLVLATFNMANGVFAGVAMVLAGIVTRRRMAAIATAAAVTVVLLVIYLHGYHEVPEHSPPALALQNPARFASYVAAYLGNIWAPGQVGRGQVLGLVGAAATAAMAWVMFRARERDPARSALMGLALFIGMSAASTALGRLVFGVEQALSSRYMTPTAYFWAAQALFWALTFQAGRSPWPRIGLAAILAVALLELVRLQALGQEQMMAVRERVLVGASAILGDIRDVDALSGVYPDPSFISDVTPFMRATHISLFADPPVATVGTAFTRPAAPADRLCRGAFDVLQPAPFGQTWRAKGWGWDLKARRSLSRVALVDGAGTVVGIGVSGVPRPDVTKAVREVGTLTSGWITAMNPPARGPVIAYGITAAGAACELGRKAWPQ